MPMAIWPCTQNFQKCRFLAMSATNFSLYTLTEYTTPTTTLAGYITTRECDLEYDRGVEFFNKCLSRGTCMVDVNTVDNSKVSYCR